MGYNEVVLAHCLSITLMVISFKHAYLQPAMGYIHLYIQSQLNVGNLIIKYTHSDSLYGTYSVSTVGDLFGPNRYNSNNCVCFDPSAL